MNILLSGKPIKNKKHGAEVGVIYALEQLGHNIDIFDYDETAIIKYEKPYDLVISMGAGIPPKMIQENHELVNVIKNNFSILWNSEPIRLSNYYKRVNNQKNLFNLHATFDETEITLYKTLGCNVEFLPQAGHPEWYHPLGVTPKKFACFIGSAGGKWKNRIHFFERIRNIIPNNEFTVQTVFNAKKVNEIYNEHYLVLNLGLYHEWLGPPQKLASYGFQQRIFEAYCAGVPCMTNYPDPIYNSVRRYNEMFTNHKDIIYYDNNTFDAMLKYFYQNKNHLIQIKNNIEIKKHTYVTRLANFLEMVRNNYL